MNSLPSCFIGRPFTVGERLDLDEEESRHLTRVLRLRVGDRVRLLDGAGFLGEGEILVSHSGQCGLEIQMASQAPVPPTRALALCIPKAQKAEWVVQKAVELGLTHLDLIRSAHSVAAWDNRDQRRERLDKIMREAAKQSGNPWLPGLHIHNDLEGWLAQRCPALWFFGDLTPEASSLSARLQSEDPSCARGVLIGPEGDFSAEERTLLNANCVPVRFTSHVLRSETAALYAASLLAQ